MNALIYPHQMEMGGSQINAIELAAAMRTNGCGVTIFAPDGPLIEMVRRLDLPLVIACEKTEYPSPRVISQLIRVVRERKIDLVHAYEWRPALEATFGPHLLNRIPLLFTILSMTVPRFLPRHIPTIVGTRDLVRESRADQVHVLEPPIDTDLNQSRHPERARARWNYRPSDIVIAVVCRLTTDLDKLRGVLEAIEVVEAVATNHPVRLLVVGGGEGQRMVEQRARDANEKLGRDVVDAVGQLLDPRDAYEAADIVIGMGSSILRGMAFGKPVVVQGEGGFWKRLEPDNVELFLAQGWFGSGGLGAHDLRVGLSDLILSSQKRSELGRFARDIVMRNFSLNRAARLLAGHYESTIRSQPPLGSWSASMFACMARVTKFRAAMALKPDSSPRYVQT